MDLVIAPLVFTIVVFIMVPMWVHIIFYMATLGHYKGKFAAHKQIMAQKKR